MRIHGKTTAREIWEALAGYFKKQLWMFSVDLRRMLQQERCVKKGDVRAQFTQLHTMQKKLAAMGQPPSKDDFYSIILDSLPLSYDPHISVISMTSSVVGRTLSPDALIACRNGRVRPSHLGSVGVKEENKVFYSNDSGRVRKGGLSPWKHVKCFNCGS